MAQVLEPEVRLDSRFRMPACTLHIGAPKTGSTAIQRAMFFTLRDRRFQYVAGGHPNGLFAVQALFLDAPNDQWMFRRFGSPGGCFDAYRRKLETRWNRGLALAEARAAHLVVSAESVWTLPEAGLRRLRDALRARGFDVRVRGYVRPWRDWLDSLWTHRVGDARGSFIAGHRVDEEILDVQANVERLRRVFGDERVTIVRFDPASFPQRCVVRDFAGSIGLAVPDGLPFRANDGLSRPAAQLAYCFHRFTHPNDESEWLFLPGLHPILHALRSLPGPKVRLHRDVTDPFLAGPRRQDAWIERELGFSLEREDPGGEPGDAIRREADLFEFTPETLDWLARKTGRPVLRDRSGEEAARAVAGQVALLGANRSWWTRRTDRLAMRYRMRWTHWRHGC